MEQFDFMQTGNLWAVAKDISMDAAVLTALLEMSGLH